MFATSLAKYINRILHGTLSGPFFVPPTPSYLITVFFKINKPVVILYKELQSHFIPIL